MKIAYIGHKRIPSNEGGIERVVMEHVGRLVDRGHDVWVLNRTGADANATAYDQRKIKSYHGAEIVNIPTVKGSAEVPIYSFLATIWCIFKRPDVVVFNASGSCVMIPFAKLFGLRTVGLLHGVDSMRSKWGRFASWYLRCGEKNLAKKADVGLVLSRNMKTYIDDLYGGDTVLFANAVEAQEVQAPDIIKERYGLDNGDYLLSLGRIVPEKGIHYLIKAFKQVNTDKCLVIAGGPDDKTQGYYDSLRSLAEGDDRIIFTGFVEGKLKMELFSNCYVFCLPSDLEGMANSLLESMSYGCCVLCSDIPENTEVVGDKAVWHRRSDVDDLRNKLQILCDTPSLAESYRHEAAPFILERFNWEKVVDHLERIFSGERVSYYDM